LTLIKNKCHHKPMTPDKIKNQLLAYYEQFKANAGLFKSFEVIFNYLNFIKAEPYTKELLGSYLEYSEKQIDLITDLAQSDQETDDIENMSISLDEPNSLDALPFFKEEFKTYKQNIIAEEQPLNQTAIPIHLLNLLLVADYLQKAKELQKSGNDKEAQNLINLAITETSVLTSINNIKELKPFVLTSPQVLEMSIEEVNKYIFDHIDSELFLANEKPSKPLYFDKDASILYVHSQAIKITLKNDKPLDHYILEALFQNEDLSEKAYFSEIAEDVVSEEYNSNWQRYRHACDNLNQKIAKATDNKILKFVKFTTGKTGWCQINPEYL